MAFFDVPEPPPDPQPVVEERQPEWVAPPRGVLPAASARRVVLFKTDRAFLMADRFLVYPNGVEFTLDLRVRHERDYQHDLMWELPGRRPSRSSVGDILRFGILLSDGAKWTNLDAGYDSFPQHPTPPVVIPGGGSGGRDSYRMRYWMWPLPPEGPLTFVCEWPAFDVPETRVDIDATELRAIAAEAEVLWPD